MRVASMWQLGSDESKRRQVKHFYDYLPTKALLQYVPQMDEAQQYSIWAPIKILRQLWLPVTNVFVRLLSLV